MNERTRNQYPEENMQPIEFWTKEASTSPRTVWQIDHAVIGNATKYK